MEKQEVLKKGHFYHIFNRGNNKENIFFEKRNYTHFLNLLFTYISPIGDFYAYCLLPNHFHILLKLKEESTIPEDKLHQPFSNLFNSYTKAVNKAYAREGSLFRKRFKRKLIKDEQQLKTLILYIHLNPIKHGFEEKFEDYPHSSFTSLISNNPTNLKRKKVLNYFGGKTNFIDSHKIESRHLADLTDTVFKSYCFPVYFLSLVCKKKASSNSLN